MSVFMVPKDAEPWPSLGGQVYEFMRQNLCFGPGDRLGQPFSLDADDDRLLAIWRAYEVFPLGHAQAGRRRFQRVGLSLRKGVAKSELSALIAACELHQEAPVRCIGWTKGGDPIGGPVTDPYIALVSVSEEQTDLVAYGALKVILENSALKDDFDIGLARIERRKGDGRAESLSTNPNARDGARTTFQCFDETHRLCLPRYRRTHQTMLNNLPKRMMADAWALETTTAPEPGGGSVAEATWNYAIAVADGKVKNTSLFFFHRQAGDHHDLNTDDGRRAAVIEASGPAAIKWTNVDQIVGLLDDPETDASYWERVWCNRLVKGTAQAFDVLRWDTRKQSVSPLKPGDLITLGFDGSQFFDSTGIIATHVESGYQWKPALWERPLSVRPDQEWQVPAEEVDVVMRGLFETYTVWRLYADPWYWQSWIAVWAGLYGQERVISWWTNRPRQMTTALEGFTTAIADGSLSHDGDIDLRRHLGNARKKELPGRDEDGKALYLIQKDRPKSPHKIDLAMAAVLSWKARTDAVAEGMLAPEPTWSIQVFGGNL